MNENEQIEKEVAIFYEKKIPIHVKLRNRSFFNGIITEISKDFFMIDDRELGQLPVFYLQVYRIEPQKKEKQDL